jgi:phospholipid/cholesterol/gamma-HCH transport system substrate-binding protein
VKRLVLTVAIAAAGVAGMAVAGDDDADRYRVQAIFGNVLGLTEDQEVRIAGARAGTVAEIHLTSGHRARVVMEVDRAFAPFRANASCHLRPQSLIGEKFVDCQPGTPSRPELPRRGDLPTIDVGSTASSVELDLIFNVFRRPYRDRLALILNELGAGLGGRARDVNVAVRRAHPALQQFDELLRTLSAERRTLGRMVRDTDAALLEVAERDDEVARFVEHAAEIGGEMAGEAAHIDRALRDLPAMLDELEPSAEALAAFARDGRPLLAGLRRAAPAVDRLLADLPPFADAARPAIADLARAAATGRRAMPPAASLVRRLRPLAEALAPFADLAARVAISLRDTGTLERAQAFLYFGTAAAARFDRISHILPAYQVASDCAEFSRRPLRGCEAHFGPSPTGSRRPRPAGPARPGRPSRRPAPRPARGTDGGARAGAPAAGAPQPAPAAPAPSSGNGGGGGAQQQPAPQEATDVLPLLDFLLGP